MEQKSLKVRLLRLAGCLAVLWFVMFVAAPALTSAVPEIRTMANFVDFSGIETGEFYYTDVEIVGHADSNARNTIEYMPHGG